MTLYTQMYWITDPLCYEKEDTLSGSPWLYGVDTDRKLIHTKV